MPDHHDDAEADPKRLAKKGLILGIDLGGSKILAAVVNHYNKVVGESKRLTPFASTERILTDAIVGCAEDALKAAQITHKDLRAIGMGSPGPLNPDTGVVLRTGNIALKNYPIGSILSKHFGVKMTLDNDVHMGCFGEFKAGAGRGCRNIVGIWIGTGVGGCVIRDGLVVHGVNRNAGEVGHMILDTRLRMEEKGRGTLETESSKTGLTNYIRRKIKSGEETKMRRFVKGKKDRMKSSDLADAYKKGDKVAVAAVEHSARYCGIAVANLFDILSPELFILGGGVTEALGEHYLKLVDKTANKYVYSTDLGGIKIALAQLGGDSGVIGAAIAARERI